MSIKYQSKVLEIVLFDGVMILYGAGEGNVIPTSLRSWAPFTLLRYVPNPSLLRNSVGFASVVNKTKNIIGIKPILFLVRAKGIEPSSSAWEADVLPLYHARNCEIILYH